MTPTQPDLSVYSGIDPDDIYNAGGNSLTFFYTGRMYAMPYPTNHDDMLRENRQLFYDVFPDLEGVLPPSMIGDFLSFGRATNNPRLEAAIRQARMNPDEIRLVGGSRGKALKFGDALLGRVGDYQGDLVMALWQPTENEWFEEALGDPRFLGPIRAAFRGLNDMVVVGMGEEPQFWRTLKGEPVEEPQPQPVNPATTDTALAAGDETVKKKYRIGGQDYTLDELGTMRGQLHSSPRMSDDWARASSVLCSDDLWNYPELRSFRPAICGPRPGEEWAPRPRSSAEKWLDKTRELYTKEKVQGREPSTGLLYPAWRAHSESRRTRLTFRDFMLLDI